MGVRRVVVGSAAIRNWPWFEKLVSRADLAGKVALGLDAREGRLAAHGWTEQSDLSVDELAGRCVNLPVAAIIYTDISRDGLLTGPDLAGTERLVQRTGLPIIASGGISGLDDILACKRIGCAGVIVGRAYYEGRVDLAEACRLVR
jgi:phosphoribosylformimino-5-aminoimidazole carboxamide ribotide isomerase